MRQILFHTRIYFLSLIIALCISALDAHAGISYFDMDEEENTNLTPFPKWMGAVTRYSAQQKVADSECGKVNFHPCVILQWKEMINHTGSDSLRDKLEKINDWGNEHPYIVDQLNWGVNDFWATPYEFMQVNGDCEDYAIAKYYSLRAAGIPADRMRIIVVQDLNLGGIIHAVLGVKPSAVELSGS